MASLIAPFAKRVLPLLALAMFLWAGVQGIYKAGYNARDAELERQRTVQLEQQVEQIKTDVQAAGAVDTKLAEQGAQIDKQHTEIKAQLRTHLKPAPRAPQVSPQTTATVPTEEPPHETLAERFGRTELDLGTVRLLDRAARMPAGADPGAAQPGDEEIAAAADTPSGIDGAAFAEHDAQVKAQYNKLAGEHDALVEFVEGICRRYECVRLPP